MGLTTNLQKFPFHVVRHVQLDREREEGINLLFLHGHHVESVAHGVEAEDVRQLLEASSTSGKRRQTKLLIGRHVPYGGLKGLGS